MTTVDNSIKPSIPDKSPIPDIKKCLGYWYPNWHGGMDDRAELELALTECRFGSKPPLQCMFDQPEPCKGKMLIELTRSSSTSITTIERELLWRAAFGQELVCGENDESPIVKASFLQWLLTNPMAASLISTFGIRAKGITIDGDLDLRNVIINFPVVLEKSHFRDSIDLTDAKTSFLSLKGSTCSSTFQARRIMVNGSLGLDNEFKAEKGIDIRGANIIGDLDCKEGRFTNKGGKAFWAEHIKVGGSLFLADGYVEGEVDLLGAKIEGNLDCSRGEFINPAPDKPSSQNEVHALDTYLAEVGGEVCFNSFKITGHVFALEMKVGGDFDCTGGSIAHKTGNCHAISLDRSNIGGNVLLCQGFSAIGQIRLIGTIVGGDLDCSGGKFNLSDDDNKNFDTALYAPCLEVYGNIFLCASNKPDQPAQEDFVTNGWFWLEFANIDHSIKIGRDNTEKTSIFRSRSNKFHGINLSFAKTGSLDWFEVSANEKTELRLNYARVGRLATSGGEQSWPNLRLDGCVYDRIENSLGDNYKTHLNWLKRQKRFNPQIYEQLAAVLRQNGQEADAKKVSIKKEKIRYKSGGRYWWLNPFMWSWWFIGYGYRAYNALIAAALVIVLGYFIFDQGDKIMVPTDQEAYERYIKDPKDLPPYYPKFGPFVYSVDAFLPIGKLHQQEKWQPDPNGSIADRLRYYLYISMNSWAGYLQLWVLQGYTKLLSETSERITPLLGSKAGPRSLFPFTLNELPLSRHLSSIPSEK